VTGVQTCALPIWQWLKTIPRLDGKAVAAFVTFGGEGGNQFNTAVSLLESLADKGGFPTGLDMFGNMSTFAITWSTGSVQRVLKYRDKPDAESYKRIRGFARSLIRTHSTDTEVAIHKKTDFREWIKGCPSIWSTKLLINRHAIDTDRCVKCGLCSRQCPVSAITLNPGIVDTKACIACLACVNNCPEQAMVMEFMHQRVQGYRAFLTEKNIRIHEPEEYTDPSV
jgi:ferredoxin